MCGTWPYHPSLPTQALGPEPMLGDSGGRDGHGVAFLILQERWEYAADSQLSTVAGLGEHLMAPRKIFGESKGHTCWSLSLICDHVPAHTNRSLEATAGGYPIASQQFILGTAPC